MYKSLVSVRKRMETNELFVESLFFEVKTMDKGKSYKRDIILKTFFMWW